MIELHALGTLMLTDPAGGQLRTVLSRPKRVALLAYIAAMSARGAVRRDKIVGVFWPETSDERARNALSQALYVLRRARKRGLRR